jgi:ribosome-associated translation inhibitor RaiA
MSKISKSLAEQLAKKLAEKKLQCVTNAKNAYVEFVRESYLKQVPKPVFEFFQKHREFAKKTTSICLQGHGFQYETVSFQENVPSNNDSYKAFITLDAKLASQITKLKNKWEKELEEYKKLLKEIESALLSLGGYAAIEKNFPEAAKLLPQRQTLALTVNLSDIRKKIA